MAKIQFEISKKTLRKVAAFVDMDLTDEVEGKLMDAVICMTEEEVNEASGDGQAIYALALILLAKFK